MKSPHPKLLTAELPRISVTRLTATCHLQQMDPARPTVGLLPSFVAQKLG